MARLVTNARPVLVRRRWSRTLSRVRAARHVGGVRRERRTPARVRETPDLECILQEVR